MPAAAFRTLTHHFTPTAPGVYKARAWVDNTEAVPETYESNNRKMAAYAVNLPAQQPDLIISALSVTPDPSFLGTELTLGATIANVGPGHAGQVTLALWEHRDTPPTSLGDHDRIMWFQGLPAGETRSTSGHSFTPGGHGSFTAWGWVDFGDGVPESNDANNKASDPYTVEIAPDLVIQSLAVAPNPSELGTGLTLTVTEANVGTDVAGPHRLAAWRHRTTEPAPAANGDYNWSIPGMSVGASETKTATFTPGFPGDRTARALADAGDEVGESDEDNNTGSHHYTIDPGGAPDLIVANLTVTPNPSTLGALLTYQATLENVGTAAAGPFSVDLWYHRASAPMAGSAGWDYRWVMSSLAAGSSTIRGKLYTPSYPGTRTAWAYTDCFNAVPESNESNNTNSCTYTISSAGLPDLVPHELTVSPNPSTLGTLLTLTATVRNTGPGAVGTFRIAAWRHRPAPPVYGTSGDDNWSIPGLADGATVTRTATYTPGYTGARRAWMYVDADREVPEGNEANNVRYYDYSIVSGPLPDLLINYVTVTPNPSVLGTSLNYLIGFRNNGTAAAGPFKLDLWYHRSAEPVVGSGAWSFRWSVSGLAATANVTRQTNFTPSYPGSRTARVLIDSLNEVPESNEGNNAGAAPYVINPTGGSGAGSPSRPRLE